MVSGANPVADQAWTCWAWASRLKPYRVKMVAFNVGKLAACTAVSSWQVFWASPVRKGARLLFGSLPL